MKSEKDTESALKWIVEILNKKHIPFQIGGGFAAKIYGVNRELADIDIAMPTDKLAEILPEVKEYITYNLEPFKDEKWELTGMTVKYKGQEIDLCGAQDKKIFDEKSNNWVTLENDFSSSEYKDVYGMTVPVMAKERLIAYKKILMRDVDKEDLKGLGV